MPLQTSPDSRGTELPVENLQVIQIAHHLFIGYLGHNLAFGLGSMFQ
jgi:hypothetical protein